MQQQENKSKDVAPGPDGTAAVELADVAFRYPDGGFGLAIPAWRVERGEAVALVGPSGSGKSTLLHLLAGILHPQRGALRVDDVDLAGLGDAARRRFRATRLGLVFQEFELLDYLPVVENILLPALLHPALRVNRFLRARAVELATGAGLGQRLSHRPEKLSQGERQRVAICRALLGAPRVLLADEPTASLDEATARDLLDRLLDAGRREGAAVVLITHDRAQLERFDRVVDIRDLLAAGGAP